MKTIKNRSQLSPTTETTKGFTLIELLVAIAMSGIVLTALGAGMMAVLNSGKASAAKVDVKNQLNRAIDYINEDIKRSRSAEIITTKVSKDTVLLTYFESLNDPTAHTIAYYIDDVRDPNDPNDNSPWLGPKVLKRQLNGGDWQVLVDRLTENTQNPLDPNCNGVLSDSSNPNYLNINGFQACIETGQSNNNSSIYRTTIALTGEVFDTEGLKPQSETISVDTDTISRSVTPSLAAPILSFSPATDLTPELNWDAVLGAEIYEIFRCETSTITPPCNPFTDATSTLLLEPDRSDTTATDDYDDAVGTVRGNHYCYAGISRNGVEKTIVGDDAAVQALTVCTIKSPTDVPSDISGLVVDPNDIKSDLTWPQDTSAIEYEIYRCETDNPAAPCSINTSAGDGTVGSGDLIFRFTAVTSTAFDQFVPWYEARNTNDTPPENKAFCYGVVSKNARGSSPLSNIECAAINQPLTLNSAWVIQFTAATTSSIDTQVEPQNMTWTAASSGTPEYELYRCQTASPDTTCDPTGSEDNVVQKSTVRTFNESISDPNNLRPIPGEKYCYAVRAKSSTEVSAFSTTICAKQRPLQCQLDLNALGFGSPRNAKSTDTPAKRTTLQNLVNSLNASSPEKFPVEVLQQVSAEGNILHAVEENSSGSFISATGVATNTPLTFPCDTTIKLKWNYLGDPGPTIAITSPNSPRPTITWDSSDASTSFRIRKCDTTSTTCTPDPTVFYSPGSSQRSPWTDTWTDGSVFELPTGSRRCYAIQSIKGGITSNLGNVVCGTIR